MYGKTIITVMCLLLDCVLQGKTSAVGSRPYFSLIERWVEKKAWYIPYRTRYSSGNLVLYFNPFVPKLFWQFSKKVSRVY